MALRSLKSLRPAAAPDEGPEEPTKRTLKPLKPKAESSEPSEPSAAPEPRRTLKPLGTRSTLAVSSRKPSAPDNDDEVDDEVDDAPAHSDAFSAMDRAALKSYIRENELDITVRKSMSDDEIRDALRAVEPAAAADTDEPAADPEPPKRLSRVGKKEKPESAEPEADSDESDDAQERAVAIPAPLYQLGQITGEIDESDVSRPQLEFVQAVGPLVEEHDFVPGQIVLAKEIVLWEKGYDPLSVIVLSAVKRFVEKVEYGGEVVPRVFNSAAEVRQAGLWTEWIENEAPPVDKQLNCLVLVQQPDYIEPHPVFNVVLDKDQAPWALAEMRLKGWNYRDPKAGKYLMTMNRSTLSKGMHTGVLSLTAPREKKTKNTITIANFKLTRMTTESEIQGILSVMQP